MDRRSSLKMIGGGALAGAFSHLARASDRQPSQARPNIILVVVDDLRYDEFGAGGHPYLKTPSIDRLAREGASFTGAFHATPLCSPNRACILTGQYTSTHAVYNNEDRSLLSHELRTFPQALQRAGYTTAMVGKWHMGNDPSPRPGFDYWVSFPGQGKIVDPELFESGRLAVVPGYVTDLLTDRALGFIRNQRRVNRPYFLYLAHKAVHPDAIQRADGSVDTAYGTHYLAAERHRGRYKDAIYPRDRIAKSPLAGALGSIMVQRFLERKNAAQTVREFGSILDLGTSEQSIRDRAEMILSIDEGLGSLLAELEEAGTLENTVLMFASDNGYFFGEHGLSIERRLPYEESIRAPLLLRYPRAVNPGSTVDAMVSSIDIAPSILDLASTPIDPHVQGRSFIPTALRGSRSAQGRSAVLIENFSDDRPMPWVLDADYKAIRTERYKLIHWIKYPEFDELYDLKIDPREEQNLIHALEGRERIAQLRTQLAELCKEAISL